MTEPEIDIGWDGHEGGIGMSANLTHFCIRLRSSESGIIWDGKEKLADAPKLLIKVDNRTKYAFEPANPKAYYVKRGIVTQEPAKLNASEVTIAAEIGVKVTYTSGIRGIIAFKCVDGDRMVFYFSVPDADSEDNTLNVGILFHSRDTLIITILFKVAWVRSNENINDDLLSAMEEMPSSLDKSAVHEYKDQDGNARKITVTHL